MNNIGTIVLFAGTGNLNGWMPCKGQRLESSNDNRLLATIMHNYNGSHNGHEFLLPNLEDKFGMRHFICTEGNFGGMNVSYEVDFAEDNYVGLVMPFEGDSIPAGWALCDGKELKVQNHVTLYALIGTQFGGTVSASGYANVAPDKEVFKLPNTGDERYIICINGVFPV
jgi:microcystin-dependent protein